MASVKGGSVVFEHDIKEENAEFILNAIRMIRGGSSVENITSGGGEYIERQRTKNEIREKMFKFMKENL